MRLLQSLVRPRAPHGFARARFATLPEPLDPAVRSATVGARTLQFSREVFPENAGGATFVMVHGAPGSGRDFRYLAPALRDAGVARDIIRADLHAEEPGAEDVSPAALARTCWDTAEAAAGPEGARGGEGSPVIFVGHSLGAHAALEAARLRPEACGGVVLLAPVALQPHQAIRPYAAVRAGSAALGSRSLREPASYLNEVFFKAVLGFPKRTPREELDVSLRRAAQLDFSRIRETIACVRAQGIPLLLLFSANDALIEEARFAELANALGKAVPPAAEGDAAGLPQEGVIRFRGGGHNIQKTRCAEVGRSIADWVQLHGLCGTGPEERAA